MPKIRATKNTDVIKNLLTIDVTVSYDRLTQSCVKAN